MRPRITDEATIARFMDKVDKRPDGCWIWTACTRNGHPDDYGQFRVNQTNRRAHRVSYRIHVGPILPGMNVCHRCDRPSCVNPDHLFVGDVKDNAADMVAKGRSAIGERSGKAVLTRELVLEIRTSSESVRAISKRLGLSRHTVRDARRGVTWSHVDPGILPFAWQFNLLERLVAVAASYVDDDDGGKTAHGAMRAVARAFGPAAGIAALVEWAQRGGS